MTILDKVVAIATVLIPIILFIVAAVLTYRAWKRGFDNDDSQVDD